LDASRYRLSGAGAPDPRRREAGPPVPRPRVLRHPARLARFRLALLIGVTVPAARSDSGAS